MKKATLFLLILFVLGGSYSNGHSITVHSAFAEQDTPVKRFTEAPATTGGGRRTAGPATQPNPNQPDRVSHSASTDNGPKKRDLQNQLKTLKTKASTLSLKGDRADEVKKLQGDLVNLGTRLADTNPEDAGLIEGFRQQLSDLQIDYNRLSSPPGSIPLQTGGGNEAQENIQKTSLLNKVKNLEAQVNKVPKDNPKKADLLNDIANVKSQLNSTDLTDADFAGIDQKISELSDRHQQIIKEDSTQSFTLWEWLILAGIALVVLGGIGTGIYFLLKSREREKAAISGSLSELRTRSNKFNEKLETLTKITTDLSQQMAQQKSELSRLKQEFANQSSVPSSFQAPPVKFQPEQPRFPVAVEDYLARVSKSQPVRFDYKEGKLVPDTENTGGMLLVQDDERVYLVPSFRFFQTKNDYSNYLERYFDCAKPMAGTVWIREPATVTKSGTGWQIVSKGNLEVR